jgi:polyribonucleotide nucleotidyltransferase
MTFTVKTTWENTTLILESGKLARQADGSVLITLGDTTVLCAVILAEKEPSFKDFTDLTVFYQERFYAAGKIPGGFVKREGKPSDKEILISRIIDRSLRPIIKLKNNQSLQLISTVLSYDGENLPDIAALIGGVAAVKLAGVECRTIAGVRVCIIDDHFLVNPKFNDLEKAQAEMFISGSKEVVTMIEFEGHEKQKKQVLKTLKVASEALAVATKAIDELVKKSGVITEKHPEVINKELIALMKRIKKLKAYKDLVIAFEQKQKKLRYREIDLACHKITEQFKDIDPKLLYDVMSIIKHDIVKDKIVLKRMRIDGRAFDEIRSITCDVKVLPKVHGSALFTRGETQVLSVVTIGGKNEVQMSEDITSVKAERFMVHYNFPSYSVGEISMMKGVGRRETGHGNLVKKALARLIPYSERNSIRVVAEVLECNGSSSMASVCAASLALMDGGIQLNKHVAGIAMGMIQNKDEIIILSDIMGDEDHLGDMDFKLTGTLEGITAIQMDTKSSGVKYEIFNKILDQGIVGVKYIIAKMHKAMVKARKEAPDNGPKVLVIKIEKDKIRGLIGPGGKVIKEIISSTKTKIDIADDGSVSITGQNQTDIDGALEKINLIVSPFRVGELYDVIVSKLAEYGIFVTMQDNSEGFIHLSDLADSYIESIENYISIGQKFTGKMLGFDRSGKVKLTLKIESNVSKDQKKEEIIDEIEAPSKVIKDPKKKRFF